MKALILTLSLVFSAAFVSAPLSAQASSLKEEMSNIGQLFKLISSVVSDPSQKDQAVAWTDALVASFERSLVLVPDSAADVPADQQAAFIAGYQQLIQAEVQLGQSLRTALAAGDSTTAAAVFKQMIDVKKDGHSRFK